MSLYEKWHQKKYHPHIHWGSLALIILMVVVFGFMFYQDCLEDLEMLVKIEAVRAQTVYECDVTKFGANGGDNNDDTLAIRAAISDCGGHNPSKVIFPQGTYWISNKLEFEDGMTFKLNNATIRGADNFPKINESQNIHRLIYCDHKNDVSIIGPGVIRRGKGGIFLEDKDGGKGAYWMHTLTFDWCENIYMKDISIESKDDTVSPIDGKALMGFHFITSGCNNVVYDNVDLLANTGESDNDSMHTTNGGTNILVKNGFIKSGDDSNVFHSGDIYTDNEMNRFHPGIYTNGMTENDFDNVRFENMTIEAHHTQGTPMLTPWGSPDDPAIYKNMIFNNITVNRATSEYGWGHGISISPRGVHTQFKDIVFSNYIINGDVRAPFYAVRTYADTNRSAMIDQDTGQLIDPIPTMEAENIYFSKITINRPDNANNDFYNIDSRHRLSKIYDIKNVVFEDITYNYPSGVNIPSILVEFRNIDGLCINNFRVNQGGNPVNNPLSYLDYNNATVKKVKINQNCEFTPPPVVNNTCACTAWQTNACGSGSCQPYEQEKVCTAVNGNCSPTEIASSCELTASCCANAGGEVCASGQSCSQVMSSNSNLTCCVKGRCIEKISDFTSDGQVDVHDIGVMMSWWGEKWDLAQYQATSFYKPAQSSHIPNLVNDNELNLSACGSDGCESNEYCMEYEDPITSLPMPKCARQVIDVSDLAILLGQWTGNRSIFDQGEVPGDDEGNGDDDEGNGGGGSNIGDIAIEKKILNEIVYTRPRSFYITHDTHYINGKKLNYKFDISGEDRDLAEYNPQIHMGWSRSCADLWHENFVTADYLNGRVFSFESDTTGWIYLRADMYPPEGDYDYYAQKSEWRKPVLNYGSYLGENLLEEDPGARLHVYFRVPPIISYSEPYDYPESNNAPSVAFEVLNKAGGSGSYNNPITLINNSKIIKFKIKVSDQDGFNDVRNGVLVFEVVNKGLHPSYPAVSHARLSKDTFLYYNDDVIDQLPANKKPDVSWYNGSIGSHPKPGYIYDSGVEYRFSPVHYATWNDVTFTFDTTMRTSNDGYYGFGVTPIDQWGQPGEYIYWNVYVPQ